MKLPCQGHFWLPGLEEKPVFGTLTFTRRDGATLSLADSLPGADPDDPETDIILGQTTGGKYLTLMHAICTSKPSLRFTSVSPCSYHATFLITGAAFDSVADTRFSFWQLHIPELKTWAAKHGFEDASSVFDSPDSPAVVLKYRMPEKQILLSEPDGSEIGLAFWPSTYNAPFVRVVRQGACFEVKQANLDTLDDYMRTTARLEHFLTLATGSLVRTGSIKAVIKTDEPGGAGYPDIVEILYQPVRNVARHKSRTDEFLFTLPEINGLEQDCFRNWLTKAEWLDPVSSLYFGTIYNPSQYLDLNFLALVQAVEAYHRRASDLTDLPSSDHEARITAILNGSPPEYRNWLEQKLAYSNEINLRRRLKLLLAQYSYLLDDDLIPDRKATISAIYDTATT